MEQDMHPYLYRFLIVLVAPVFEEFTFRGFMNMKRQSILLSISLLSYALFKLIIAYTVDFSSFSGIMGYSGHIISLIAAVVVYFVALKKLKMEHIQSLKEKYFKLLFYGSAFAFALIHITNFELALFTFVEFLFLLILMLPYLISAFVLSYLRIHNGIGWAIAFHMMINSVVFLTH
jgi:hypothetical protein